jgi:transposase
VLHVGLARYGCGAGLCAFVCAVIQSEHAITRMRPVICIRTLDARVAELDAEIRRVAQSHPTAERLQQLRGVGPITATALLAAAGHGAQFSNGRQMAASLGLTLKQHSSGGKDRLLGISKRGDSYLRMLLVHGARSAMRSTQGKTDRLSQWVTSLSARSHPNVAAVALANKTARMAWSMLRNDTEYQPDFVTN